MQKEITPTPFQMRFSKSSLFVLEGLIGIVAAPYMIAGLRNPAAFSNWIVVITCVGLGVLISVWLHAFRITLTKKMLRYQTLFSKREILLTDIKQFKIEVGSFKYIDKFRPDYRLVIELEESFSKSIDINLKIFSKNDVDALLEQLFIAHKNIVI